MKNIDKPKNFEGVYPSVEFTPIHTGQAILLFKAEEELVDRMNKVYDDLILERTNIDEEYTVYLDDDNSERENHNLIPDDIHEWIKDRIHQYLNFIGVPYIGIKTHTAWVNDTKEKEYNPLHFHQGAFVKAPLESSHSVGLIGMLALKIPTDMGPTFPIERSNPPMNGCLQFVSSSSGKQFVNSVPFFRFSPGDFVVFPYDMYHCVYPHFNKTETRRTMPTNIDVFLPDPFSNLSEPLTILKNLY